jgi:nucleotide-binding universal stress UspA family protein
MKPTIKHILVPTDFSTPSDEAVDYAMALGERFDATVHLIHVLHDPTTTTGGWEFYVPDNPQVRERRHNDAKDRLCRIASPHAKEGVRITTEVRFGSPTDEIVSAAIAYGSDMVVMGTHGRTGLPHLLLGSIAERVIRTAPCPVLAVRQQLAASLRTNAAQLENCPARKEGLMA